VSKVKAAADKAASAREAAAGQLARAAKAVADCERAVERERQKAAIKSMKEREKEIREAARVVGGAGALPIWFVCLSERGRARAAPQSP
jgi:hypothetical protein